jgi:hypothetical protein
VEFDGDVEVDPIVDLDLDLDPTSTSGLAILDEYSTTDRKVDVQGQGWNRRRTSPSRSRVDAQVNVDVLANGSRP